MNKKYIAAYDLSKFLSDRLLKVDIRLQEILFNSQEKTRQNINSQANKLAYELAEKNGLSLWDVCLRTIPTHTFEMKELGKIDIVITLDPIEFDFEHSPEYWEQKYNGLKKKLQELLENDKTGEI